MSKNDLHELGRGVSVEMKHQRYVKNMIVSEEERGCVLFEGNLGQLIETSMVDNSVLEVIGENGILRIDLKIGELDELIKSSRKASEPQKEE
ncbi:hypothetical protein E4H04_05920 [Candidatus Bathyarchaeota archaeon]|nr:MAG: hypothetical protein E4H04_05920 [Candidatus Bathyarchaeota archaeon]